MSAERTPPTDDSMLAAPLAALTGLVLRAAIGAVGAVVLAVLSVGLAATRLGFRTSRLDLLDPNSPYNQLWLEYLDEFGGDDDAVVVVQGSDAGQVVKALDAVASRLAEEPNRFQSVLHEVDCRALRRKGLHYLSVDELQRIEQSIDRLDPILAGQWSNLRVDAQLAAAVQGAAAAAGDAEADAHLQRVSAGMAAALRGDEPFISPWPAADERLAALGQLDQQRFLRDEGRVGFLLLRLAKDASRLDQTTESIVQLRAVLADVERAHPTVTLGLTGLPVMENDEMQTSQSDMLWSSVLSLVGVAILFVAGLGGLRHALLAVGVLAITMGWSFGYITLAVGHLNILSVAFGVILIGLGIDFGVHYVARYLQIRLREDDPDAALTQTARSIGPGVLTGAATTAIAFFTAYFTQFRGVAELGVVAGGGLLLCVAGALFVLPAAIKLFDGRRPLKRIPQPLAVERWVSPFAGWPRLTICVTVLATVAAGAGMSRLYYDHNLLNLQAEGLESVRLERMLFNETEQSVWFALSIASDREELLRRKQQFLQQESVDHVEEIASLLPPGDAHKQAIIARIGGRLARLPAAAPLISTPSPADVERSLSAALVSLPDLGAGRNEVREQLAAARAALTRLPPQDAFARISTYQQQAAEDLLRQLQAIAAMSDAQPPTCDDLPPSLVSRFVGRSGRHLLKIYGKGDIWDMDALGRFVGDVKRVDPRATGQPLQTYFASRQMQRSYINAALYALAAVTFVLLLDFQSVRMSLLAMLPVAAGMAQMFGLMGWFGIPLNPANMIVLPLILGIGLDDGVHVVHEFRQSGGRFRLSRSTAAAIVITSLTSMIGFGSLMIANHRGLQSLGRVLTIGVTCCLVSSLVLLPALLAWISRGRAATVTPAAAAPPPATEEVNASPEAPAELVVLRRKSA